MNGLTIHPVTVGHVTTYELRDAADRPLGQFLCLEAAELAAAGRATLAVIAKAKAEGAAA